MIIADTALYNGVKDPLCAYRADCHLFIKAMNKANITFPTTKSEIIEKLGNIEVQYDYDKFAPAKAFIEKLYLEEFDNALFFWEAMLADGFPGNLDD